MKQKLNRIISACVALLLCVGLFGMVAMPASAESGTCGDNVNWTLENGVLTISGSGAMTAYTEHNMAPWLTYANRIQRVVVEQGVTNVGSMAFYQCEKITSVTLASSVKTIGSLAFVGCTNLRQVTMSSVERLEMGCFHGCLSLSNVILPQSLQYIGDEAFFRCKGLGGITVPKSVTYLGDRAFAYCDALASVFIEAPLTALPEWVFYGCNALSVLKLPASIADVGDNAVVGCDSLYHVDYSGSAAIMPEINKQLDAPITPGRSPGISKDVTYTQTENAVITTTNTNIGGDTAMEDSEKGSTYVDATVTSSAGWSDVTQAVTGSVNSGKNPQVDVQLEGDTVVPEGALSDLADKDVTVTVQTQENVQWQINMNDQTADSLQGEQQLSATMTKNESVAYDKYLQGAESYTVTLGETSVNSTLMLPLGNETARQVATLYQKKGNKLEKLTSVIVDDQGRAAFSLAGTKEGEYVVALDVQSVSREEAVIPQALAKEYNITYGATLTDAYGNQYVLTGRVNKLGISLGTLTAIVLGILVGTAILVGVVMTIMNKQKNRYRKNHRSMSK